MLYCGKQQRSLRWNEHYNQALDSVSSDVQSLLSYKGCLQPISTRAVAGSDQIVRNLKKNAGYLVFESGKRSKGENLDDAVNWVESHLLEISERKAYNLPLVMSHRSSNSKPVDEKHWKWRCRVILMQDLRALLLDGRFLVPFTNLFINMPWGEGGMTQQEVRSWIQIQRKHYDMFYSSDYSKFDTSQASWLLEDVFDRVIRPVFGQLSDQDEKLFEAMVHSYIHKDIHGFDGVYHADGCQVSGSLGTYAINTIVNEVVDRTALLMQGCDIRKFKSLKCGDDNLTFFPSTEPWNAKKHQELIQKYFGIGTTLTDDDWGPSTQDPKFLSKTWTYGGECRAIEEVVWNLMFPERYRDYDPSKTGISTRRAEALVLLSACLEQEKTMQEWFDVSQIYQDAGVRKHDLMGTYKALAAAGTGFRTPWLDFKFGNLGIVA
jgi:hypothetical protein